MRTFRILSNSTILLFTPYNFAVSNDVGMEESRTMEHVTRMGEIDSARDILVGLREAERSLRTVFLNRRAVASIIPGHERLEETTICYKISLVKLITNLNIIFLFVNMPYRVRKRTNTLYVYDTINY